MFSSACSASLRSSLWRLPMKGTLALLALALLSTTAVSSGRDNAPPPGFTALFNGHDLTNWQGLVPINKRAKLSPEELKKAQEEANKKYLPHWTVKEEITTVTEPGRFLRRRGRVVE